MYRTLEIVTIGDSLTLGMNSSFGSIAQSYPDFLEGFLSGFLSLYLKNKVIKLLVVNQGVNGDITQNMLLRFKKDVIDFRPKYVIVLGGTNDLGWGVPVQKIFSNLKSMFHLALNNQIEPLGCTVPSLLGWDEGIPPRLELNNLIKNFCQKQGVLCADLFQSTSDGLTNRLNVDYSDDGLHLNAKGYQKMAETIFFMLTPSLLKNFVLI